MIGDILDTAIPIVIFFLILGVVVTVHELGHFIMARRAGIFVKEFALGMGPKLLTIRGKKKTAYPIEDEDDVTHFTLRLFPIGGFCAVRGQDDEMPDDPEAMGNKSIPQRAWFMLGGSVFNFIAALVLFFILSLLTGYNVPQIYDFSDITVATVSHYNENNEPVFELSQVPSPVRVAGLMPGDRITHINGTRVSLWASFRFLLDTSGGLPIDVRVNRGGQSMNFTVTPVLGASNIYQVGFIMSHRVGWLQDVPEGDRFMRVGIWGSLVYAADTIVFHVRMPFRMLAMLATGQSIPGGGGVMGPIGIAGIVTEVYQVTSERGFIDTLIPMLSLTAMISVALGIMNLLPIPALDGARLLFLAIEAIRRKPVSQEREGMVHIVGFVILIALGIFIAYRDIVNLIAS